MRPGGGACGGPLRDGSGAGPEPRILALDARRDAVAAADLFARAADYIRLETGRPPTPATTADFFNKAPPGCAPASSLKFGQATGGRLISLADLAFGFPDSDDAYIGLLLLDPAWRGRGLGAALVAELARQARARGARRLLAGVLEANPAGRRFWEREGFRAVLTIEHRRYGDRFHRVHRMARPLGPAERR